MRKIRVALQWGAKGAGADAMDAQARPHAGPGAGRDRAAVPVSGARHAPFRTRKRFFTCGAVDLSEGSLYFFEEPLLRGPCS